MLTIYYDGSFDGFLTLLSDFILENRPIDNIKIHNLIFVKSQNELFYEEVVSQPAKAKNFYCYLKRNLPREFFEKIYIYYLCDTASVELSLIKVLRQIEKNPNIWQDFSYDEVIKLHKAERSFYRERHRWLGFMRFIELPNRVLFAKFEPKFNVLPKLWTHFVRRFPNEKIIIFDSLRKLLFLYKERKKALIWVDNFEIEFSAHTDPFINLWKNYFLKIAIPERQSYERQRSKIPLSVRKFLPEFWEDL